MSSLIFWAPIVGMPFFAYQFMASLIIILQRIKTEQPLGSEAIWACTFFALMMWTISGTLLMASGQ